MKTKFNGILTLLLAFVVQISFAQSITVSGVVSDESGPLPGVSVLIKGTTKGVETDFDGKYSISAKTNDVLTFSFLGYKSVDKLVNGSKKINVVLQEDNNVLDEVVVVGYGTKAKRATTGSITTIKSEAIENVPVANLAETLQGQSPGLISISNSGQPGSNSSVQIRGKASVNGLQEPLYIIDGVAISAEPINNFDNTYAGALSSQNRDPLSNLNPADIESITVLKDASSTSIYGSRAANGIIMITTKKGKQGKAKFEFNTQVGVSARAVNKFKVLNTAEWIELRREGDINAGFDPAQAVLRTPDSDIDTNWADYAYRDWNALTKKYNFSVSGGNEKLTYRTSLGYFDQEGVAVGSGLERYNAGVNIDAKTSEESRVGMNVSLSRNNQKTALAESAYYASPVLATYLFQPTTAPYLENGLPNPKNAASNGTSFIQDNYYNKERTVTDRILSSVYGELDIFNDFKLRTQFGIDKSFLNYKSYKSGSNTSSPEGGGATRAYQDVTNWTLTTTLGWKKLLGEKHNIDVILGHELNHESYDSFDVDVIKFPNNILQNIGSAAEVQGHNSATADSSLKSWFLNANYAFDQKYHLNTTIRRDGSSRFGENNKWGTFWSVGGNWVLNKEAFLENVDWVNTLKLQASYGVQGNLPRERYWAQTSVLNATYNNNPATYPSSTQGNPDLKWEQQKMFDVGIEFGLFNKLNGNITYFDRTTSDLIFEQKLEPSSGFGVRYANVAEFKNSGIELNLSYDIFNKEDFGWSINGNVSKIKNEVTKLDPGTVGPDGIKIREVGEAWETFNMPRWAGVDVNTGAPMWYDKDNKIVFNYTDADRVKVGKANPDYYGAFGTNVRYKGFDLAANFTFQTGNKIYNNTSRITNSDGAFYNFNQSREQLDRWQQPGDISANPRRVTGNSSSSNQLSTRWLEDGDYIRLRNVALGYNFPNEALDGTFFNNARVYLQGTNLLTFSNFNADPEQSLNGTHWFRYPNVKTVSLGLNLTF